MVCILSNCDKRKNKNTVNKLSVCMCVPYVVYNIILNTSAIKYFTAYQKGMLHITMFFIYIYIT